MITDMMLERLERHDQKLLSPREFYKRLIIFGLLSLGIILFSLGMGMLGYILFEGLAPVDAFLNAAMLMGGMGPVNIQLTDGGKIFAGFYAMYCGFILIFSVAIFMTPVFQRSPSLPPGGRENRGGKTREGEIIASGFFPGDLPE